MNVDKLSALNSPSRVRTGLEIMQRIAIRMELNGVILSDKISGRSKVLNDFIHENAQKQNKGINNMKQWQTLGLRLQK